MSLAVITSDAERVGGAPVRGLTSFRPGTNGEGRASKPEPSLPLSSSLSGRVLLVDDDVDLCRLLDAALVSHGFEVASRFSAEDAIEALAATDFDVILTDIHMSGIHGLELCERIVADRPDVPVVILTASGNLDTAIASIRAGAYDFIAKPPEIDVLAIVLQRAVQHRRLYDEVKRLRVAVRDARGFEEILASSPVMQQVTDLLARIADSDSSVLITGESGTGKELLARALHARSRRSKGSFVAVNCAAMPEALLESELFGHVRGAFTGAVANRTGLFAQADGGTILLDEIAELPVPLQPKLLRALQERAVRPVGSDTEVGCDARIVAATNQDLETAVQERRFREDLYFRINVIHVYLPPLRTRGNDVLLLAQHFIERYAARTGKAVVGLSPAVAERFLAYAWPGNVRELQNCIERAVVLARLDRITVDDLPEKIRSSPRRPRVTAGEERADLAPLEEVERRHVLRVLDAVKGSRTLAAHVLGLDRKTLYRKLRQYRAQS